MRPRAIVGMADMDASRISGQKNDGVYCEHDEVIRIRWSSAMENRCFDVPRSGALPGQNHRPISIRGCSVAVIAPRGLSNSRFMAGNSGGTGFGLASGVSTTPHW